MFALQRAGPVCGYQTGRDYLVAGGWCDKGTSERLKATLYIRDLATGESWFSSELSVDGLGAPISAPAAGIDNANDPLGGAMNVGRRTQPNDVGGDGLGGQVKHIWGLIGYRDSAAEYEGLVNALFAKPQGTMLVVR